MFNIGLENFKKDKNIINRLISNLTRVGILCNTASVDSKCNSIVDILVSRGISVKAVLSPQHGYMSIEQANMIESKSFIHPLYKIPIYSLYSKRRSPDKDILSHIDCLIIDLQDVGVRVYTFIWTMFLCLQKCAKYNIKVILLDRPNPINCKDIEGGLLDESLFSFVGLHSIPIRHSATIGELAQLFNVKIKCDLEIVGMSGYNPELYHNDLNIPWIITSPNLPSMNSVLMYPCTVLLEGTNVSEGRGTTLPFELVGASFIDSKEFRIYLNSLKIPGVLFRETYFKPYFDKFTNKVCGGVHIYITDRNKFRPYYTGLIILQSLYNLYPKSFHWNSKPYEYEFEKIAIDLISGDTCIRDNIKLNKEFNYYDDEEKFRNIISKFRLY